MSLSSASTALLVVVLLFVSARSSAQPTYHDFDRMTSALRDIVGAHGDRASIRSIGASAGGRDLWLVTIGSGEPDRHPAVLVVGGAEGSRIVGSELTLRFVRGILEDPSDSTRRLLERTTFYVLPRVDPDAAEQFFARLRYERDGNSTATDDDRDGATDEDGYDDLDGNGMISQIRVRSAAGTYIADPDDPRIVRPADAARGERGMYEVYSEGRDDDGDGRYNEDGAGGVSFNRNFPFEYPYFGTGAGPYQISESESRSVADFCYDHQNIAVVFTFASQNNLLDPWVVRPGKEEGGRRGRMVTSVREADQPYMARVSELFSEITGLKDGPPYARGEGSFVEWAYYDYGRWSFGANGWWMPKPEKSTGDSAQGMPKGGTGKPGRGPSSSRDHAHDASVDVLAWLDSHGGPDAYVNWTKVDDPDFPGREVEVGGFAPFVRDNPPPSFLDSLGALDGRFITFLGTLLPRVEGANLAVEKLGPGLARISLDVVSTGFLPTLAAMGATSRVPIDVKAELELSKGQRVAAGNRVQLLGPIGGSGGVRKLSWIVQGSGPVTIRVGGPMAGEFVERVEVK
jgi:hypothetical protein